MDKTHNTGTQHVVGGRPEGRYRFSARFIRISTKVLLLSMGVLVIVGFAMGFLSDSIDGPAGDALENAALLVIIGGFLLPLLIAAVLGGEAIKAGAGFLGFGLIAGLALTAVSSAEKISEGLGPWEPLAFWGGIALMIGSGIGFWIVGFRAKVPMWIQAPFSGSPRVYVQGTSEDPGDVNASRTKRRRRQS